MKGIKTPQPDAMVQARSSAVVFALALAALIGFAPAAMAQAVRPLVTQSVDDRQTVELPGNLRPEANADNDRGPAADTLLLAHMQLLLRRPAETEAALVDLIDRLHDQNSPDFHQWLDGKRLRSEFGPAQSDVDAVTAWLASHGMIVHGVRVSGMVIDFSGTAAQVRDAFHAEIHALDVHGTPRIANMSNPRIPAALAGVVNGVVALHDFPAQPQYTEPVDAGFLDFPGYALVPGDLWTIYNFNPLLTAGITGKGQTIVVVEDTNVYDTADWTTFRTYFGLTGYTGGSLTQVHPAPASGTNNCSNPGVTGDAGEATLDTEWASAAAPDAAIVLASCADTNTTYGFLTAAENLIDSSSPPAIVSMSYGVCEAVQGAAANAAFNTVFQAGVAEGTSIFVSAGDQLTGPCNFDLSKAAVTDGLGVNGMASTPYNVAAGGTDFTDAASGDQSTYWSSSNSSAYESALKYIPEVPWNNSCASPLVSYYLGFATTYGSAGSCSTAYADGGTALDFVNNSGGSGGPSACATGTPKKPGVVGGTCKGWPKPSWQKLVGNPADGVRDLPDVSLFASNGNVWGHAYVYCYSNTAANSGGKPCSVGGPAPYTWSAAGGTSFVSPILAGIQALVNQKKGAAQGNPNTVYYALAKTEYGKKGSTTCDSSNAVPSGAGVGASCIFIDITGVYNSAKGAMNFGSNDAPCTNVGTSAVLNDCYRPSGEIGVLSKSKNAYDPTYPTATGWDFATGIGSINVTNLVDHW